MTIAVKYKTAVSSIKPSLSLAGQLARKLEPQMGRALLRQRRPLIVGSAERRST